MAAICTHKYNHTYKRSQRDESKSHKQRGSAEESGQVLHAHDPGHYQGEEGDVHAHAETPHARYRHHPLDVRHEGENWQRKDYVQITDVCTKSSLDINFTE